MRTDWRMLTLLTGALLVAACSDESGRTADGGGGDHDGPVSTGDGPPAGAKLTWLSPETLDVERAGKHASIASCGDKLAIAYFRTLKDPVTKTCPATFGGSPTDKPRPAQDLMVVTFDGSSWGEPVKVDQTYGPTFGISIAMDSTCGIHVGYLGGAMSQQECNSSDAIIASSTDNGKNWSTQTVSAAGDTGDTVGHWMAVAVDSGGTAHSAYRDVHFGYYEQDGNAKASLWYDGAKVSGDVGAGVYAALRFAPGDKAVIVHYNGTKAGAEGGIQLAVQNGGNWTTKQLSTSTTNERLSLATDGNGLFGVSFYKRSKEALYYLESSDLGSWSETHVDTNLTRNGEFSSLAFDSTGQPAIAYYLCNDYGESDCDFTKDGVNFATRRSGSWKVTERIDDGGTERCGEYASLTFAPGDQPVVAYKCVTYNNLLGESVDTLRVIRGVYK